MIDTIGYSSQENIPIIAIKISDNASIKEDEPRVLFVGQVHAEEILGVEIVLDLINDLLFPDPSINTHMNILKEYLQETKSKIAENILTNFDEELNKFIQVCPIEMLDKLDNPITIKGKINIAI